LDSIVKKESFSAILIIALIITLFRSFCSRSGTDSSKTFLGIFVVSCEIYSEVPEGKRDGIKRKFEKFVRNMILLARN
jgi:hypothetical protein